MLTQIKADVTKVPLKDTVIVEISTDNSRDIEVIFLYTCKKQTYQFSSRNLLPPGTYFIAMTKPNAVIINDDAASPCGRCKTDIKADRTSKKQDR